jgi:DNA-binding transcriptional regulator YdaS (Cro superfamily)
MDIKQIARAAGGVVALSLRLGLSRGAVSQWCVVPPEHVISVSEATCHKYSPHQIRPDLYPHPDDGLPEQLRRHRQDEAAHDERQPIHHEMQEAA